MITNDQVTRRAVPSAASGAVRLRRVDGGRRHAIKVRLDDTEYDAITARAADCKLSVQRFLVSCALARRPTATTTPGDTTPVARVPSALAAELIGLRRLTANLASNINQIARALNSGATPDSTIPAAADAVRRVMARLDSALAGMTADPSAWQSARPVRAPATSPAPSAGCGSSLPQPAAPRIVPEAPS